MINQQLFHYHPCLVTQRYVVCRPRNLPENKRIKQADEAQHRHYNDGYGTYPTTVAPNLYDPYDNHAVNPNPFDHQYSGAPLADPFNPPPHNPYSSPPPPPPPPPPSVLFQQSQHIQSNPGYVSYPPTNSGQVTFAAPGPSITPNNMYAHSRYDLNDEHEDTGDIPLLRRDPSSLSSRTNVGGEPPIPGSYDDEADGTTAVQEESSTNIRYGRIPQRVPRRYKTIKKFE